MVRKEYSAGGVKHPFWFLEFKKAAILRDQGVTWEGLRTRSREENLFSAASPARAEMTCNTVEARMQTDRKSTRLNSSHPLSSRMPSSA